MRKGTNMSYCNNCGNKLNGENFCTKCGARVSDNAHTGNAVYYNSVNKSKGRILMPVIIICAVLIAVVLFFVLGSSNDLTGEWRIVDDSISTPFDELEFFSDNTYVSDDANYDGSYSIDGDRIRFEGILVSPIVCTFDVSGNTLTLIYDEDEIWEFERVE